MLLTSRGWVRVASLVDRGTYDADVHTQASGVPVRAEVKLDGYVDEVVCSSVLPAI